MKLLKFLVLSLSMLLTHVALANNNAVPMLENTANQIIATLKENKANLKQDHKIIHQAVQKYLLPHVDLVGMSRSVLGREAWNAANTEERKEFTQVFTELVIRTYATPLAQYSDETVKFQANKREDGARFTRVNSTIIRSSGQNIPLSYSLVNKNGEWKIYDLSVEGVSLLQSFRSQFGQVLQNSNMKALIAQMRQQKAAS